MNNEQKAQSLPSASLVQNGMLAEVSGNRNEIESLIRSKKETIKKLEYEVRELERQWCLVSDDKQWFTEKIENVTYRENRKKKQVQKLIGRIHWNEDFTDEDTGNVITIERQQVVRVDGKWEW